MTTQQLKRQRVYRTAAGIGGAALLGGIVGKAVGASRAESFLVNRFNTKTLRTLNRVREQIHERPKTLGEHIRRSTRESLRDMDFAGTLFGGQPRPYEQRLYERRFLRGRVGKRIMARGERRGAAIGAGVGGGTLGAAIGIDRLAERRKQKRR